MVRPRALSPLVLALSILVSALEAAPAESGEDPGARLEALERARDAGILSDEEYERKKAEIEARGRPAGEPALSEALRKKLDALEAAHEAGILSDEELARKREELLSSAGGDRSPAVDEATRAKIAALEAAHEAGVLSADELARKRAELLGGSTDAAKGNTYRHPVGFTFWYPEGWKTVEQPEFLQLVPPDAGTSADGPTEIYGVTGESVAGEGIRSADDPRVVEYFDGQARELLPNLRRKGAPAKADTAKGKGIVLRYEGTSPNGGPVLVLTYAAIIGDFGVGLVALGLKDQVEAREPDLRRIFASFGMGEGKRDPRLVGAWTHESFYRSGTFSSTTILRMSLEASGKFVRTSNVYASMEHKDSTGESTGSTHAEAGPAPGDRGQWAAADARLYLLYDDGSYAEYEYEYQPGNLLLKPKGGKPQLWTGGK